MPSFSIPAAAIGADAVATAAAAGGTIAAATIPVAATGGIAATLASIAPYASLAGGVISGAGAVQSAEAQGSAAKYQAQVAANNEQIAKQNAQLASAAGSTAVEAQGLKERATVGAIEAGQAASNVDVNSGSALDVRTSAVDLGQLEALTIRSNAEKQVYGYETAATGYAGQQQLEQSIAVQAPVAGAVSGLSSVLSGVSGAGKQYSSWQQAAGSSGGSVPLGFFSNG